MRYLRNKHSIAINSSQKQKLRNIGYYHGYKGYRFIRIPTQKIRFQSFNEIMALNSFDMSLKSMLYPPVMLIETAFKSYVIESILNDSRSEILEDIFNKSITAYRSLNPGSDPYKKEYTKRMQLKGKINSALIRDYTHNQKVVNHFFDNDAVIPIWAIFESLTLGEFGTLFSCSNLQVKRYTSSILKLPKNLDSDGQLMMYMIFTLKDLRNAIAHNNIIFDTRFKTGNVNKRLKILLESEINIQNINFNNIDAYIILITYILRKTGQSKTDCKQIISTFLDSVEKLRTELPSSICNQILGTQLRSNMNKLKNYVKNS